MLRKLLKYDLRSISTIWIIMAASVLGISVFAGFCFKDTIVNLGNTDYIPWSIAGIILAYIAFVAFGLVTGIMVYFRFYKSFYSDEGYLTFTLPVKRSTLLFSKLLNGMIWSFLTGVILTISVIIILSICPMPYESQTVLSFVCDEIGTTIKEAFMRSNHWVIISYIIEAIIALILISATGYMFMYFCITVSSVIAKKNKVLVAVGIIYGSSIVISIIQFIFSFSLTFWMNSAVTALANITPPTNSEIELMVFLGLLLVCTIAAVFFWTMWSITLNCIERKLNLA